MSIIDDRVAALAADFDFLEDWEARIGHVIDLGRHLAPLADDERTDAHKVRGCASQVWVVSEPSATRPGALRFRGQSDATIVNGLIAVLVTLYSDATPREILDAEPQAHMQRLGLADALTAQRANGLVSMIKRIQADARGALAQG